MKLLPITLLLSSVLSATYCSAQTAKDDLFQIDLRKNIQTEAGILVLYTVKDKASIETVCQKWEYFWYADGKLHNSFGGVSGEPLNGEFNCYYKMGNLKENGFFNLGLKNGKWTTWYESGRIKSTYTWVNGVLEGVFEEFDIQGSLIRTGQYTGNLVNGKVLNLENGKLVKEEKYKGGIAIKTKLINPLKSDSTIH